MYTVKQLAAICKTHGFSLTEKSTLSRCVGDGILQQIYYGDKDHIWIGLTSLYSDLPRVFWESRVPFTTYLPIHLKNFPSQHFENTTCKEEDISLLINCGLAVLDGITTQEKLIRFAIHTNNTTGKGVHLLNNRFWGAYILCDMADELMYEVCRNYTDICEGFRRAKENTSLLMDGQYDQFVSKYLLLDEKLSKISGLWRALLLEDQDFLKDYALVNLNRNLECVRSKNIPIVDCH